MEYGSIYEAIKNGSPEDVKIFLKDPMDYYDDGGRHALHIAARFGKTDIVKLLLEDGRFDDSLFESIGITSDFRGTALTEALRHGHLKTAKLLVKYGSDVNESYFVQNQDADEYFYEDAEYTTETGNCFMLALSHGDDELLQLMAENGLDPDVVDHYENTAIYYSVLHSDNLETEKILGLGANPNQYVRDENMGQVPLLVFAVDRYMSWHKDHREKALEIVRILLSKDVDLSLECYDCEDLTVMDRVLENGDEVLQKLFGLHHISLKIQNLEEELDQKNLAIIHNDEVNQNDKTIGLKTVVETASKLSPRDQLALIGELSNSLRDF